MEYGAIDLHARQSLIRHRESEGTVVLERTMPTRADTFRECLAAGPRSGSSSRAARRVSGWRSVWSDVVTRWWSPIPITR